MITMFLKDVGGLPTNRIKKTICFYCPTTGKLFQEIKQTKTILTQYLFYTHCTLVRWFSRLPPSPVEGVDTQDSQGQSPWQQSTGGGGRTCMNMRSLARTHGRVWRQESPHWPLAEDWGNSHNCKKAALAGQKESTPGVFGRRCLFRQPNACQKELLQQQLSGFVLSTNWGHRSGGEHWVIASTRQSGSKRRGRRGTKRDFSAGFGQKDRSNPRSSHTKHAKRR